MKNVKTLRCMMVLFQQHKFMLPPHHSTLVSAWKFVASLWELNMIYLLLAFWAPPPHNDLLQKIHPKHQAIFLMLISHSTFQRTPNIKMNICHKACVSISKRNNFLMVWSQDFIRWATSHKTFVPLLRCSFKKHKLWFVHGLKEEITHSFAMSMFGVIIQFKE
jgi:hypothetical protein